MEGSSGGAVCPVIEGGKTSSSSCSGTLTLRRAGGPVRRCCCSGAPLNRPAPLCPLSLRVSDGGCFPDLLLFIYDFK